LRWGAAPCVLCAMHALSTFARTIGLLSLPALLSAATPRLSFPKPDADRQFAELKVYDAEGRAWRTAVEDWDGARRRVAQDPAWAAWAKQQQSEVDRWMAKHHDRVEWIAGWSHDGVSPKDGSRVKWTEQIPGEEVQFFSSSSDPKIEITPKLHAWWVVTFRGRHVETMVRAAQLFRLTGDAHYAKWVIAQMDFYADHFLEWKPQKSGQDARLFWQTLTEASNLVKFTEAVRLLGDTVPAAQRAGWRTKFFQPEVTALNKNFQTIHNIATWQRCAVAQVALLFGDEAMWRAALDGPYGLRRQMTEGITSDYLWYEQSLGYNVFVVKAVNTLFTMAGLYGRAGELAAEMSTAENLMIAPAYLRFPDGRLPNPADSGTIGTAPNRELFGDNYRIFPTTLGLEVVAGQRNWDTLLDPPAKSPRPVVLPPVTSRSLESTRMALLKDGPWQVFVHYGQLTRSHSQNEALNFSAYYGGTDVTHDAGTVGYGSPLYQGYYTRGLAQNVPLINGEGQNPPEPGQLVAFSATPARVEVAQPKYREGARAGRTLAIEGDTLIDRSTVESTKGPQRLGLALHFQGKARLPESFKADDGLAAGRPKSFSYWRGVRRAAFHDRAEFDVAYGGKLTLHVTVTAPGDFTLWHGSSPDVPPTRRESFYLELAAPAAKAEFTTTMRPAR
jgi:oligo-alginate lyase